MIPKLLIGIIAAALTIRFVAILLWLFGRTDVATLGFHLSWNVFVILSLLCWLWLLARKT